MLAWNEMEESNLRTLNASVFCGDDSMIIHLDGDKMSDFMIDEG